MPLAVILTAALAAAPKSSAQQADALFSAARALLQSGRAADACPLLEKSQALDPALGTQLNLAECYERVGRRARAFLAYADAFAWAQRSKDKPRQEAANGRMEALKPKLAWLTLSTLTPVREPAVSVNDVALRLGALPRTVPAEPGVVTLTARAPGHLAWMGQLPLEATQAHSFTVPPLVAEGELAADAPRVAEAPAQPSPPPAEPEPAVMPPPLLVPQAPATPVPALAAEPAGAPSRAGPVVGIVLGGAVMAAGAGGWRTASPPWSASSGSNPGSRTRCAPR